MARLVSSVPTACALADYHPCPFCSQVPAGKTDQVQPIDDGAGQQYKLYIGQEEDAWLEDDENLRKWENDELTASDRRILFANWYVKAHHRVVQSRAVHKYFEHTGGLLTADGTGDELIKLEGMPKGHRFTWVDDEEPQDFATLPMTVVDDPPDVQPSDGDRQGRGAEDERDYLDDGSDDEDEDDVAPAPRTAPAGYEIVEQPDFPPAALEPKAPEQQQLVGKSMLYRWPSVGWCVGVVTEANGDGRRCVHRSLLTATAAILFATLLFAILQENFRRRWRVSGGQLLCALRD
jgi:hypothetical protein